MMTTTAVSTILTVKVNRAVEDVKEETWRNRRITMEKHIKDDPR
jgi:hypothetical protein